jgi:hypothetical protein
MVYLNRITGHPSSTFCINYSTADFCSHFLAYARLISGPSQKSMQNPDVPNGHTCSVVDQKSSRASSTTTNATNNHVRSVTALVYASVARPDTHPLGKPQKDRAWARERKAIVRGWRAIHCRNDAITAEQAFSNTTTTATMWLPPLLSTQRCYRRGINKSSTTAAAARWYVYLPRGSPMHIHRRFTFNNFSER